jgi:hypothetical protein
MFGNDKSDDRKRRRIQNLPGDAPEFRHRSKILVDAIGEAEHTIL